MTISGGLKSHLAGTFRKMFRRVCRWNLPSTLERHASYFAVQNGAIFVSNGANLQRTAKQNNLILFWIVFIP